MACRYHIGVASLHLKRRWKWPLSGWFLAPHWRRARMTRRVVRKKAL